MDNKYFILAENFSDKDSLKYYLGSNEDFKRFWFKFAECLGFFDQAISFANPYGREIKLDVQNDTLNLKRERIYNRVKIEFFDFKFTLNPQSIEIGRRTEKNLETKEILLSNYRNYTTEEEEVKKALKLTKSTTTTVSSSHKIATSVGLSASTEYSFPMYSDNREVSFTFSYEYNMGNQKEQTETTQIWDEASLTVQPKTQTYLKLIVYTSSASAAFTALANISFSVSFRGWLSLYNNVYKDQKSINPRGLKHRYIPFTATFGSDKMSALEDIRTQIANKDNPNSTTLWDWEKFLSKPTAQKYIVPYLNKDFAAKFYGEFSNVDSTNVLVEFGPSNPL